MMENNNDITSSTTAGVGDPTPTIEDSNIKTKSADSNGNSTTTTTTTSNFIELTSLNSNGEAILKNSNNEQQQQQDNGQQEEEEIVDPLQIEKEMESTPTTTSPLSMSTPPKDDYLLKDNNNNTINNNTVTSSTQPIEIRNNNDNNNNFNNRFPEVEIDETSEINNVQGLLNQMPQDPYLTSDYDIDPILKEQIMEADRVQMEKEYNATPVIDHLVFIVHGMGNQTNSESKISVLEQNVDLLKKNFNLSQQKGSTQQLNVEFRIIEWHSKIRKGTLDEDLDKIKPDKVEKLRGFINETLFDIMLYMTPDYHQEILKEVSSQINQNYKIFLDYHPKFRGLVSIFAHSLGSVIMWDVLSRGLLKFNVENVFALGSPLGLFLRLNGYELGKLDMKKHLPNVYNWYNIFSSTDPVSYRIEPFLDLRYLKMKPLPIQMFPEIIARKLSSTSPPSTIPIGSSANSANGRPASPSSTPPSSNWFSGMFSWKSTPTTPTNTPPSQTKNNHTNNNSNNNKVGNDNGGEPLLPQPSSTPPKNDVDSLNNSPLSKSLDDNIKLKSDNNQSNNNTTDNNSNQTTLFEMEMKPTESTESIENQPEIIKTTEENAQPDILITDTNNSNNSTYNNNESFKENDEMEMDKDKIGELIENPKIKHIKSHPLELSPQSNGSESPLYIPFVPIKKPQQDEQQQQQYNNNNNNVNNVNNNSNNNNQNNEEQPKQHWVIGERELKRHDFVLEEGGTIWRSGLPSYLVSIFSHMSYWDSKGVANFLVHSLALKFPKLAELSYQRKKDVEKGFGFLVQQNTFHHRNSIISNNNGHTMSATTTTTTMNTTASIMNGNNNNYFDTDTDYTL
ncbi:hypothetical protein DFA_10246 [Cavenderia fasciculata]|uniref:DDHD domain-containing protein n=1 Tax=Cavenderia fasciculata TaxID=261658 RepID=F4Q9P2_CACFS|nr:uncharacterized protein DFA_10246 [Cavenderia fasciculata]EGG15411.1 hypothetical protein DFA_10246 [Cavenderia fasciculata]|eukprot:XP_004354153.1 hypothetical protein DFA_10246 [Cavenderia fasciculata]